MNINTNTNNRECYLCGKSYYYCPNCSSDFNKPTWMIMFESENCRDIFNSLQLHYQKEITDDELLKTLDEHDISNLETFNEVPKKQIKEVLSKRIIQKDSDTETKNVKIVPRKGTKQKNQ